MQLILISPALFILLKRKLIIVLDLHINGGKERKGETEGGERKTDGKRELQEGKTRERGKEKERGKEGPIHHRTH